MRNDATQSALEGLDTAQAEEILMGLAQVFLNDSSGFGSSPGDSRAEPEALNLEARYRTLIEQIPAVVFMVYLDRGVGEAYVNPQIETILGFSREEWLEDPIRWYERIHPDDKHRWSTEAAEMFLSGKPLRSVYRVIAREGHAVSFHCDARMVRRPDGRPWFIHGVGFDITDLKRAEEALHEERNFASAVVDTVGALVLVLDPSGRIVRFNRACEQTTGYASSEVIDKQVWDLFAAPEEAVRFHEIFEELRASRLPATYESAWATGTFSAMTSPPRLADPARHYRMMEVCGGHTHAIYRFGLKDLLPPNIELVHGPGCPVCVLPMGRIDDGLSMAARNDVIFTAFGDMMRVPGTHGSPLEHQARGADIRIVYSPADALKLARANPHRHVVFFAIGFETTAPSTALTLMRAKAEGIRNFSVFCNHVTIIPAIRAILDSPDMRIDAFIGLGHVSTVIGCRPYEWIARHEGKPIVVSGFEPLDVLQSVVNASAPITAGRGQGGESVSPGSSVGRQSCIAESDGGSLHAALLLRAAWNGFHFTVCPGAARHIRGLGCREAILRPWNTSHRSEGRAVR
jgi:PAS domain S-box-containing protein